jgi:hypothetical protein
MTLASLECSAVVERLIGGERPGSDAQLSEHVGSCLTCFRTASDLRGLPQLREQLMRAQREVEMPDPGEAFWSSFPKGVTAAWAAREGRTVAMRAAEAPAAAPPGLRQRLSAWTAAAWAWLQQPVPAACAGAVCSAIIVVLVTRPTAAPETRSFSPVSEVPSDSDPQVSMTAGGLVLGGAIDDSIKDLDVGELRALRTELQHSMEEVTGAAGKTQARAQAQAQGRSLVDGQAESSPTALSDDLDELNEAGLAVLAENLEGPI